MKKIFLIITLLCNLMLVKTITNETVYASTIDSDITKPLIAKLGENYQHYLEYDDYEIISSNVNFKKSGTYKVLYQHIETGNQLEKTVYVKGEEELTLQKAYSETYSTLSTFNENINITNVKKYKDDYYVSYTMALDDGTFDIGFMKISNGNIIFDGNIFRKSNGKVVDFIVKDEEIILMVEKANTYSYLDMYYIVMSHKGAISFSCKYEGRGVETGSRLLESTNYYYLVLDTTSREEGDFSFQHSYQSGVVFMVEKETNKKCGVYEIVGNNDVAVIDAINIEDEIYVAYEIYNSETDLKEINIAHINTLEYTTKINNFSITLTENIRQLKLDNENNIYIATSDYNYEIKDYVSKIYKLNTSFEKELIQEYQYPKEGNCNLIDIFVYDSDNITSIYSIVNLDLDNPYGYLYQIIENKEVVVEFEDYSASTMVNGFITPSELLFIDENEVIIDEINYSIFTDLKQVQVKSSEERFKMSYPTLFINGENTIVDLEKSVLNYDLNIYGRYHLQYYFSTKEVDVVTNGIVEVLPYTNVYEGGVFDLNTQIITNGKATLNSLEIESGYEIKNSGSYKLVLKNNNNDIYTVNFEVSDLSDNSTVLKEDIVTFEKTTTLLETDNVANINNHISEEALVRETNNNIWLILIPFCALVGLGIVVFSKR